MRAEESSCLVAQAADLRSGPLDGDYESESWTALGFILIWAIYQIGRVNKAYPVSFHDVVSGNNSALEFDSMGNPVSVTGFSAGNGCDQHGLGSTRSRAALRTTLSSMFARRWAGCDLNKQAETASKPVGTWSHEASLNLHNRNIGKRGPATGLFFYPQHHGPATSTR